MLNFVFWSVVSIVIFFLAAGLLKGTIILCIALWEKIDLALWQLQKLFSPKPD